MIQSLIFPLNKLDAISGLTSHASQGAVTSNFTVENLGETENAISDLLSYAVSGATGLLKVGGTVYTVTLSGAPVVSRDILVDKVLWGSGRTMLWGSGREVVWRSTNTPTGITVNFLPVLQGNSVAIRPIDFQLKVGTTASLEALIYQYLTTEFSLQFPALAEAKWSATSSNDDVVIWMELDNEGIIEQAYASKAELRLAVLTVHIVADLATATQYGEFAKEYLQALRGRNNSNYLIIDSTNTNLSTTVLAQSKADVTVEMELIYSRLA